MQSNVQNLIRALYETVGNKRYMHDIEELLKKLPELTPNEQAAIRFLASDLRQLKISADRKNRMF